MGPGQGLIALSILSYLEQQYPDCLAALHYSLVETSPALTRVQQQQLQPWRDRVPLRWCNLEAIPSASLIGCCFSNELMDALPVHRVILTDAGLQEQYVTLSDQADRPFAFVTGPLSRQAIAHYFEISDRGCVHLVGLRGFEPRSAG